MADVTGAAAPPRPLVGRDALFLASLSASLAASSASALRRSTSASASSAWRSSAERVMSSAICAHTQPAAARVRQTRRDSERRAEPRAPAAVRAGRPTPMASTASTAPTASAARTLTLQRRPGGGMPD